MPKWRFGFRTVWLILGLVLPMLCIHYGVVRSGFWLLPLYGLAFTSYIILFLKVEFSFPQLLAMALLIRLVLFFGAPSLSDDYFRFVWDGRVWTEGYNPYASTPEEFVDDLPLEVRLLYHQLNSPQYHSTYPPFSQYLFSIPDRLGIESMYWSITVLRGVLFLFEIGVIWLLFQLTTNASKVLVYALNPLVILELIGNLHFEGIIIFFILLAWWFYQKGYWIKAALALSFGILTKLTPLMFLPLLLRKLGIQKSFLSYFIIGLCLVFFSIPFLDLGIIKGMGSGLDLFFRKFEFNAGLFFLVREMGYWVKGYDVVQTAGPWLSYIAFVLIVGYALLRVDGDTTWAKAFTIILLVQLLFATTVHPWYVIPLLAFSCVSRYLFPMVWSGVVFLSYLGYSDIGYQHPLEWITIEYIAVIGLAGYELIKNKPLLNYA